ncbi:MAG: hypothetical protein RLZZ179_3364 [Verrucomicrobiota bacterium]|jgi:hypothetical protein
MRIDSTSIVSKVWNYAHVLKNAAGRLPQPKN